MDGTQFLVQWDEHPSHLATRLGYLLEHQSLVDVTLMCNTHTLKVHRAVLAACSPYFERQLGNHPLIVLKDMKFSVLKSLVEFMYCGETSVSEENLTPLLEAARFFEVKGLSSMTKETVCSPSTGHSIKNFNGAPTPTTSGYGRGSGRGRGRGRGRPPLNPSTKIGSPTESAQILLSLSGNNPSPQLYTTSKNVKIDPGSMVNASGSADMKPKPGFEPRRRGRKRGAINTAFRDRIMRDVDTQLAIENLKRDLSDDGDSPLLSSLLAKSEVKQENSKYVQQLKDIGLPTNVPILIDNGDGKLLSLTEDVLKTVVDSDGNLQLQVAETNVNKVKKNPRPFVVKEMEMQLKSDDEEDSSSKTSVEIKSEFHEEHINEEVIENLKNGGLSEAELEPDAVVLFEVTDKIEKFVLSAKDVSLLKSLNEQLTKQKKELSDITRNNVSTVDVIGTNTKIAELKLKIGKTKSILSQFVHLKEKLKRFTTNGSEEVNEVIEKKEIPQVVHLEIFDGSGEKIKGIELHGTVDKRNIVSKESLPKDSGDYLGLFDMVCDDGNANQSNPLLGENSMKKSSKGGEAILTGDNCESKEMSYQLVSLDDQTENISYDPIEAMMNDASGNIVIEEKTPDLKYIIDNDGNIMNQDENYVVYESENVIYDNPESILPDVSEGENSSNYVVPERVISNESTEYIVEYNDKNDISDEIKGMEERGEYIVYHDPSKENYEDDVDNGFENNHGDHNFDSTNDVAHNFQNNHVDHGFDNHVDHNFDNVETVKTSYKDNFIMYSHENKDLETDGEIKPSPTKDVPFAVGLVPLKDALEKFQSISEHHPRRTRSNSMNGETLGAKRRSSSNSDNSDYVDKKRKVDPTLVDAIPPEESL